MQNVTNEFPPPAGLSQRACSLWAAVVPSCARSPSRLAAIEEALRALDRADAARAQLDAAGSLTTTTATTGAVHVHPLVKVEREARQQFLSTWDKLSLMWRTDVDGRR